MPFDPTLGADWMFDAEDLAANNAGRLSAEQERLFRATVDGSRRATRRSSILLVVVFGAALAFVVVMLFRETADRTVPILVVAGAFGWMGLILVWAARRNRRHRSLYATGRLRTIEGPLRELNPTMSDTWVMVFDDADLEIDTVRALTVEAGRYYRVHLLQAGSQRQPIAIERIAGRESA